MNNNMSEVSKQDRRKIAGGYIWSILALCIIPAIAVLWLLYYIINQSYAGKMPISNGSFAADIAAYFVTFVFVVFLVILSMNKRYVKVREIEKKYEDGCDMPPEAEYDWWVWRPERFFIRIVIFLAMYISFLKVKKYIGKTMDRYHIGKLVPLIISVLCLVSIYTGFSVYAVNCLETERSKQVEIYNANDAVYQIVKANVESLGDAVKSSDLTADHPKVRYDGFISFQINFDADNFVQMTTKDLFQNYDINMQVKIPYDELKKIGVSALDEGIAEEAVCLAGMQDYLGIDVTPEKLIIGTDDAILDELKDNSYSGTITREIDGRNVYYHFGQTAGMQYVDISITKKYVKIGG